MDQPDSPLTVLQADTVRPHEAAHCSAGDSPLQCGPCTACCTLLKIEELQKPMRHACDQVTPAGCRHYADRPRPCREFECLWRRGLLGPEIALRPDQLGVMFDQFAWRSNGESQAIAMELWTAAFDQPVVQQILHRLNATQKLILNNRTGDWCERPAQIATET